MTRRRAAGALMACIMASLAAMAVRQAYEGDAMFRDAATRSVEEVLAELQRRARVSATTEDEVARRSEHVADRYFAWLDVDEMARRSAEGGAHEEATPTERARYIALFRAAHLRITFPHLERILREMTLGAVDAHEVDGDLEVHTVAQPHSGAPIDLRFRVRHTLLVDWGIDGTMTTDQYGHQFARLLATEGWTGLLTRMARNESDR